MEETALRIPDKVMFHYGEQKWTFKQVRDEYAKISSIINYTQVNDLSNRLSHFFLSLGFSKGDSVALFMHNRPEFAACLFGMAKASTAQ